jgi:DNA (cytosine-5)-methyltransferase 1
MLHVVDLFAGCGGISLGFQDVGFEIVGAFERWDAAADCYAANFGHPLYRDDLSEVEAAVKTIRALYSDIIICSPPCQDFSRGQTSVGQS